MSVAVPATMCPAMLRKMKDLLAASGDSSFDQVARDGGKSVSVVKTKWREPVTLQADLKRVGQGKFRKLIFLPEKFCRFVTVRSWFVQRIFLAAKAAVDFSDNFPVKRGEPGFDKARHGRLMRGGFSQAGVDALQCPDALAFEVAFARARENRLGGKTVLNAQRILHDSFKPLLLSFRHASNDNQPFPKSQIEKLALKFVARRTRRPRRFWKDKCYAKFPIIYSWPPCWRSNSAISLLSCNMAKAKGVLPLLSLALMSALFASSNSTRSL